VSVLYNVLKYSKSLSEYNLQTEELDIAAAAAALSELMSQVEGMRNDDECKQQYDRACAMIKDMYSTQHLLVLTFPSVAMVMHRLLSEAARCLGNFKSALLINF